MAFLGGVLGQTVFVIFSLVVLYYFYQYLFAFTGQGSSVILNGSMAANPTNALVSSVTDKLNSLPAIYEGGEYSVNVWVYINDWSVRKGYNKHVLSIGGSDFLTFAIYLKPYTNALAVTVRTTDVSTPTSGSISQQTAAPSPTPGDLLTTSSLQTLFNSLSSMPGDITTTPPCDIPSIDLQKWVQVTLALNNKTSDVYIDGKLARSCVLPSFYRVSRSNVGLKLCDFGGFGGYVANVSAYNYSLNPEQVWKMYMNGPGPQYAFTDYWNSLFNSRKMIDTSYPKMNIVG